MEAQIAVLETNQPESVRSVIENVLADAKKLESENAGAQRSEYGYHVQYLELMADRNYAAARWVLESATFDFPNSLSIKVNLSEIYIRIGELKKAEEMCSAILKTHSLGPSNYMMVQDYLGTKNNDRKKFNCQVSKDSVPFFWDGKSKIKIAYLTSNDHMHPVGYFLSRIINAHDCDKFSVGIVSDSQTEDALKYQLEKHVDWHIDSYAMNNQQIFDFLRQMKVDVLVDTEGHTCGGRRIPLLGMRPCPLQIQGIGYPNDINIKGVYDFMCGAECCTLEDIDINTATPVFKNPYGYAPVFPIRYGAIKQRKIEGKIKAVCLATPSKITKQDIVYFASLIDFVSITFFRYGNQYSEEMYERIKAVDSRFEFLEGKTEPYFDVLASFDLALDTTEWSGHTTTLECLSHGLPVLLAPERRDNCRSRLSEEVYASCGIAPPDEDMIASPSTLRQYQNYIFERMKHVDTSKKWTRSLEGMISAHMNKIGGF